MTERRRFDTRAYLMAQSHEVLGPLNRYYTGQALGRDPSAEDCWRHWCATNACDAFRAAHQHRFWVVEVSIPESVDEDPAESCIDAIRAG